MVVNLKYILCFLLLTGATYSLQAQTQAWQSPEVEAMYNDGRNYMSSGNLAQAIAIYQQAIQLAPGQLVLHRELGRAYYMMGNYDEAKNVLEPIITSGDADDQSYQAMAQCLSLSGDKKRAKAMLQKGIASYPHSGLLYHDMGKLYDDEDETVYALETWLDGIQADPGYHVNYYEAARTYMNTNKTVWAILYGEMFVNIERQTPRAEETKQMLFEAYKKLYTDIAPGDESPKYKNGKRPNGLVGAVPFEEAVRSTYLKLSPVVSDGISAESLAMLRARFSIEWSYQYASQYPFTLFTYYDVMLRNGFFDMYNEWLFGKAESPQQYESWNAFHTGDMPKYEAWAQANVMRPAGGDFYNDKQVDGIFGKKKKK